MNEKRNYMDSYSIQIKNLFQMQSPNKTKMGGKE